MYQRTLFFEFAQRSLGNYSNFFITTVAGFSLVSTLHGKNTYQVHSFFYRGEQASIICEEQLDRKRHYIQIGEDQIFQGRVKADSGKIISIQNGRYNIRDFE